MALSLRKTYLFVNVLLFATWLLLVAILYGDIVTVDEANIGMAVFLLIANIIAAVSFLLYGSRLYRILGRTGSMTPRRRRKMIQVGVASSVSSVCFVIKAAWTLATSMDNVSPVTGNAGGWVMLGGYVATEILPACVLLFILRDVPKRGLQYQGWW